MGDELLRYRWPDIRLCEQGVAAIKARKGRRFFVADGILYELSGNPEPVDVSGRPHIDVARALVVNERSVRWHDCGMTDAGLLADASFVSDEEAEKIEREARLKAKSTRRQAVEQ